MRSVVLGAGLSMLLLLTGCMQGNQQTAASRSQVEAYLKAIEATRNRSIGLVYEGKADDGIRDIAVLVDQGRNMFGLENAFTASAILAKGAVLREAQRFPEAETDLRQALGIFERRLGPNSPSVGNAASSLALTYQQMGRFPDAEPLRRRALEIAEKDRGATSDIAGVRLGEVAESLLGLGRYVEAEEAQQKGLEILEKAGRTDWIVYITSLNRMAEIYRNLDRREDMEAPLRRAVSLTTPSLPNASYFALRTRHSLGLYLLEQGRVDEAEACLREGLDAAAKAEKGNPLGHALLLQGMAEVKDRQGAASAASELRKRAQDMLAPGKVS